MSAEKTDAALPAGAHWTPLEEALAQLEAAIKPVGKIEETPIEAALGRWLAEDAVARRDHPAGDNSAVDGYAFAHPGRSEETRFQLVDGRAAAGSPWPGVLAEGEAVRIFTGALTPEGSDTVALQEDAVVEGGTVRFTPPKRRGANRRLAGENIHAGDVVLPEGAHVTPQAIAQLASAGLARVNVRRPLRVAVFSTGDELAAPNAAREDHLVIDANGPMLAALLREIGMEPVLVERLSDDRAAIEAAFDRAAIKADAIVTSGGASGGDEDHVAALLESRTAEKGAFHLWRIAMKPGRPMAMGVWNGAHVFGLPGNPVAAFVCFLMIARPALTRLSGGAWPRPKGVLLPAGFGYPKKRGRREFLRARIGSDGRLEKYRSEGSGLIEGLLWSDGLVDLAHEAGPHEEGDLVRFYSFAELGVRA